MPTIGEGQLATLGLEDSDTLTQIGDLTEKGDLRLCLGFGDG
jgi:hypothetical protein